MTHRMASAMDIAPAEELASVAMESVPDTSFAEKICVPFIRQAQNSDGGWGFRPGTASRAEPTCWALKALLSGDPAEHPDTNVMLHGLNFLRGGQLLDGSWPSTPEEKTGCWVTSLACWVLESAEDEIFEGDGERSALGLRRLAAGQQPMAKMDAKTIFVGPAFQAERCFARMGLDAGNQQLGGAHGDLRCWPWKASRRRGFRELSGGAPETWRSVALRSHVSGRRLELRQSRSVWRGGRAAGDSHHLGAVGFAAASDRRENIESLAWMERNFGKIQGPGSYALAQICLSVYGRKRRNCCGTGDNHARDYHAKNESLQSMQVAAWMTLASRAHEDLAAQRDWRADDQRCAIKRIDTVISAFGFARIDSPRRKLRAGTRRVDL